MGDSTLTAPPRRADAEPVQLDGEVQRRRGRTLGRYELVCPIAQGGMAIVWAARLRGAYDFSRNVAIKLIRPEFSSDTAFRSMFLDEARIAAQIRHLNVVEVLELGEEDAAVYQVMPLIDGDSLHHLLRRAAAVDGTAAVPTSIALRVMHDALLGLHAAHELSDAGGPLGIVHRDVSPHNILVATDGVTRIADFGIAKALGRFSEATATDSIKGKLAYMSPEQLFRGRLDRRTDLFAAGIVLWEALAGVRLFAGESEGETVQRITAGVIPDLRVVAPHVPEAIAAAVQRALAAEPDARPSTALDFADALDSAARGDGEVLAERQVVGAWAARLLEPVLRLRHAQIEDATWAAPRASIESAESTASTVAEVGQELGTARSFGGKSAILNEVHTLRARFRVLAVVASVVLLGVLGAFGVALFGLTGRPAAPGAVAASSSVGPTPSEHPSAPVTDVATDAALDVGVTDAGVASPRASAKRPITRAPKPEFGHNPYSKK